MSVQTREPSAFPASRYASYLVYRQEAETQRGQLELTCYGESRGRWDARCDAEPEPARNSISMTLGLPQSAHSTPGSRAWPPNLGPFAVLLKSPCE